VKRCRKIFVKQVSLSLLFAVIAVPKISVVRQFSQDRGTSIVLAPSKSNAGSYSLLYTIRSQGIDMPAKKELDSDSARELGDILLHSKPEFSQWGDEKSCLRPGHWRVSVANKSLRVCQSETEVKVLQDFQSAVSALFQK
jgi:hypothetical protein